ncbi:MAG: hydrogenase, partial [Planctomycetaceae bacterium]|nr:hydrogenase [Planctomycetaceae bacterium]
MASISVDNYDNTVEVPGQRAALVVGQNDYQSVTDKVCLLAEKPTIPPMYFVALGISVTWLIILKCCIIYLLTQGVGVWGNMSPVFWGWPIVNFVFWVGIGHAGTLISAILFLFRQNW